MLLSVTLSARENLTNYARCNVFLAQVFCSIFKIMESTIGILEICFLRRLIDNWTPCRTIQEVIVLVIQNGPRSVKITRATTL